MAVDLFSEIGVLILISALGGALAIRFRQPSVLGLLFIGAIAGPGVLGLVKQTQTIMLFADIGAVLLLFTIGIEFSISNLLRGGLKVFLMATTKLALVFLLSYELAIWMGLSELAALYLGVITSITSTALFIRVAEQKGFANRDEVLVLVGMLIVEDLFAIFALTFFSSLGATGEFSGAQVIRSIIEALAILGLAYLVLARLLRVVFEWLTRYQAAETLAFATLGLGVGLSYLAQLLGLTPSIGAFLAGSLVASLPRGKDLEKAILPFALVFSSMFFVSMGMFVNPASLAQNAWIIAVFCVANLVFKFSGTTLSTYAFGFGSASAVFSGLAMLSVGEFSLLVAIQGAEVVGMDLVGITAAMVFTSALATSLLVGKHAKIHALLYALIPAQVKIAGRQVSSRTGMALRTFEPGAALYRAFETCATHIAQNLAGISVLVGIGAAIWFLFSRETLSLFGFTVSAFTAASLILAVIAIRPLFEIAKELSTVGDALRRNLERNKGQAYGHKLALRFGLVVIAILAVLVMPFVLAMFETSFEILRVLPAVLIVLVIAGFLFLGKANERENVMFFKRQNDAK